MALNSLRECKSAKLSDMKNVLRGLFITLLLSYYSGDVFAETCSDSRSREEYFCLDTNTLTKSEISEVDFITIPYQILSLYQKEFSKLNYPVVMDLKWTSPYFGAGVSNYQKRYSVMILGGTTRIDEMTKNALAALVCHEFGHIIGGSPLQKIPGSEWASTEGQSDYFAASECLPRYFKFLGIDDSKLDDLIEEAGFDLFHSLKWPSTQTREQSLERHLENKVKVEKTLTGYPNIQCRYETFRSRHKRSSCWFKD